MGEEGCWEREMVNNVYMIINISMVCLEGVFGNWV